VSSFQVGPETFVTVVSEVFDAEGEPAGEAETTGFVFGRGLLFARVERALEGHLEGDVVEVRLEPKDAFGQRDPKGILEVDRDEFPPDVAAGDRFEVENADGGILVIHVLDVGAETVHIDTNHPLAGQAIVLRVRILEVRLASSEELEAAERELEEAQSQAAELAEDAGAAERPHVSVSSLIRSRP
jgi:FKBP-type peptidyl-prolyl cis-trans isomerase SlyD